MNTQNKNINQLQIIQQQEYSPFANVRKGSIVNANRKYSDDQFSLTPKKQKTIIIKRLSQIFKIGSSIKQSIYQTSITPVDVKKKYQPSPNISYTSQILMLSEEHFISLIQPQTINELGYYYVVAYQDGRICKKLIDDYVYFDQQINLVDAHLSLERKPWVYILMKAWAKHNNGYQQMKNASPFSFIRTFSFPSWCVLNLGIQQPQTIIRCLNKSQYFIVGKTKSDKNIGLFGLNPNSCSYLITGLHEEYHFFFVKVHSILGDKWNNLQLSENTEFPSEPIKLQQKQFLIPLKLFRNIFHLIYYTFDKYSIKNKNRIKKVYYNKKSVNFDARQGKSKVFRIQNLGVNEQHINLCLYFPFVNSSNFATTRQQKEGLLIPKCKIMIGKQTDALQGSLAESAKQKFLNFESQLNISFQKYEFIKGQYFQGYSHEATYHLKVKPGRYILRLKLQKLLTQYKIFINSTSTAPTTINEIKIDKEQSNEIISQLFINLARQEERSLIASQSNIYSSIFIMANNHYKNLGYSCLVFLGSKNKNITVIVDLQLVKQSGYRIKNRKRLVQNNMKLSLKSNQSDVLIFKQDFQWTGKQRIWPPLGIQASQTNIQ